MHWALLGILLLVAHPSTAVGALAVERATLDNGLRLVMSTQSAVPIVAISCLVDGGARLDPSGKAGLANLSGELLSEGTKGRSSQDIARIIDGLGGSFESSAGDDWIGVAASVLARDFEVGIDLVARSLREPTFPEDELTRRRAELLGGLEASEDQPGEVASRAFRQAVFGSSPYGHDVRGTPAELRALTRAEVVAFHQHEVRPDRVLCAIVGDVPTARMRQVVEDRLANWKGVGNTRERAPAAMPPARKLLVDKPISQANLVLGHLGIERANPRYFAVLVMNHILGGGGFTSRLMRKIRTEAGLAYSVGSHFSSNRLPGSFEVVLQTKVETAADAVRMAREEIARIREEGVTPEELDDAQKYLTGSFPLRLDSTGKIAGLLAQVAYFGLGDDYIERYPERVRTVTSEDVKQAAREFLHPDALVEVLVGPQAKLAGQGAPAESQPRASR